MKIIGHRGARGYEPENTLRSIQRAIELEVDMVEFDVYVLPTGEVVLMHDPRVDRTTDGEGPVDSHNFAQLRDLDAGKGEPIPTLQEALDMIDGQIGVNIELKGPGTAKAVADILEEYVMSGQWTLDHFLVSSFDHHELKKFRTLSPYVEIAVLEHTVPLNYAAAAEELGAMAVNPNQEFLTQAFVDDAHRRGLKVYAYTINHAEEVKRLLGLGVDGLITDYPDKVRRMLGLASATSSAADTSLQFA